MVNQSSIGLPLAGDNFNTPNSNPLSSPSNLWCGFLVNTIKVVVTAARCRSLFSSPLTVVTALPGYCHVPIRFLASHDSGVNHNTAGVTGLGLIWQADGVFVASTVVSEIFPDGNAQTSFTAGPSNTSQLYIFFKLSARANSALQLKTSGADLSGSGTFDLVIVTDYVSIPVPITA